ncbi:FtsL-like putative cell division protein [Rikenella microfusus]|nr:FtsL-like putative cell division protein [Rikenella microfusus]
MQKLPDKNRMLFRKRHKIAGQEAGWEPEPPAVPAAVSDEDAAPPDWREPDAPPSPEESPDPAESVPSADGQVPRRKKGIRIGQFFTGGVLSQDEFTRRLPVIVYGVFLMLLYIANGFHLQHKHSELDRIADELKQLKTEAVTSSAVRMTLTRQSEIERLLRERGIPLVQDGAPSHVIED